MDASCLFCLEPIIEQPIQNPIGCPCKVQAHKQCFDAWILQKNQMECPICHTVSIPNQMIFDNVQIIYVNTTVDDQQLRRHTQHQKAALFCCMLVIGWSIGVTILDLAFGS